MRERSTRFPLCSSIKSSVSATAESIPRARKSILIMRASSTESLSHWTSTRPGIADCSRGTSSTRGLEEMTMPPTCWLTWRGDAGDLLHQVRQVTPKGRVQLVAVVGQAGHLLTDGLRGAALADPGQPVQLGERQG